MDFLYDYGLFLFKAITVVIAMGIMLGFIVSASMKNKGGQGGVIEVTKINDRFDDMRKIIKSAIHDDKYLKREAKAAKKAEKTEKKQQKAQKKDAAAAGDEQQQPVKRVFLLDFNGDIKASAVTELRECVSALLLNATPEDEVVVRLESAGGMVHSYGLAASQLHRIRQKNIQLSVCVDKVAASGGYMMACVANKICAAPFAVMGSIGVVAQLPNFHKLLKKHDVDFELFTAGEYKRTLTLFGENTDKGRQKFVDDLEITHQLFKDFVKQQRPVVDIDGVATGEVWFGTQAKERLLVDELTTSDDYIAELADQHPTYFIEYKHKKTLPEKIGLGLQQGIEQATVRVLGYLDASRFFK
ncbi:MAG: protease SohB [Cellvibrionaceae bacterium]|nr:protease SohB [Cellvibrionaceae bacterium]